MTIYGNFDEVQNPVLTCNQIILLTICVLLEFSWNNIADRESLSFLDPHDLLEDVTDTVLLSYSLCECGEFIARHIV